MDTGRVARVLAVSAAVGLAVMGTAAARRLARRAERSLPDSAFACVETGADGKPRRHLPHHDINGQVNVKMLKSALRLWHFVRWENPAYAGIALEHLRQHQRELCAQGKMPCPRQAP